jgi:hypothetical protein
MEALPFGFQRAKVMELAGQGYVRVLMKMSSVVNIILIAFVVHQFVP